MTLTITSPSDEQYFSPGNTVHCQCTAETGYDSIVWKTYDEYDTEIGTIGTTESFDWVIPDTYNQYIGFFLKCTAYYSGGGYEEDNITCYINHDTPIVKIFYPLNTAELKRLHQYDFVSYAVGQGDVTVTWQVTNTATGEVIANLPAGYDTEWTVPQYSTGNVNITVTATATNELGSATASVACVMVEDDAPVCTIGGIPSSHAVTVGNTYYLLTQYDYSAGVATTWSWDIYQADGTTLIQHLSDSEGFEWTVPDVSASASTATVLKLTASNYIGSSSDTINPLTIQYAAPSVSIVGLSDGDTVQVLGQYPLSVTATSGAVQSYLWEVLDTANTVIDTIATTETTVWNVPLKYYVDGRSAVKLRVSATNPAGTGTKTISLSVTYPDSIPAYLWKSARTGSTTSLHTWYQGTTDGMYHGVAVLRQGINGFSSDTKAITSTANLDNMGEFLQEYSWNRRDGFGFRIAILGSSRTEIDTKRRQLLSEMSDGGELHILFADNTKVHIHIDKANLTISDGLEVNPRVQYADLSFTALNPYFYGNEVTASGLSGNVMITNAGNVPAEATFTLSANTVTRAVGSEVKTIAAVTGQSLSGVVLTVRDNSIAAVSGTTNAMHKFTLSSQFFMLVSGSNVVNGISAYSYVPRWSAI